jgi:hypothetical protein
MPIASFPASRSDNRPSGPVDTSSRVYSDLENLFGPGKLFDRLGDDIRIVARLQRQRAAKKRLAEQHGGNRQHDQQRQLDCRHWRPLCCRAGSRLPPRKIQQILGRSVSKACRKGVAGGPGHSGPVQANTARLAAHAPAFHNHLCRDGYCLARGLVLAVGRSAALAHYQDLTNISPVTVMLPANGRGPARSARHYRQF